MSNVANESIANSNSLLECIPSMYVNRDALWTSIPAQHMQINNLNLCIYPGPGEENSQFGHAELWNLLWLGMQYVGISLQPLILVLLRKMSGVSKKGMEEKRKVALTWKWNTCRTTLMYKIHDP